MSTVGQGQYIPYDMPSRNSTLIFASSVCKMCTNTADSEDGTVERGKPSSTLFANDPKSWAIPIHYRAMLDASAPLGLVMKSDKEDEETTAGHTV